jgi:hypothetical protein
MFGGRGAYYVVHVEVEVEKDYSLGPTTPAQEAAYIDMHSMYFDPR